MAKKSREARIVGAQRRDNYQRSRPAEIRQKKKARKPKTSAEHLAGRHNTNQQSGCLSNKNRIHR
jgi:hypothetical protein